MTTHTHALQTSLTDPLAAAAPGWLDRSLYPFPGKHLHLAEGRMHYLDEGTGSPVLLVHGTPSWSFEWRHVVQSLRGTHRCVAPDHLGFGLSDKRPGTPYRPEDHSARLLRLVDELDLRDVTLVVHDFGGPIGLRVALERRERVRKVVLTNTWMWPHGDQRRIRWMSRLVRSSLGRWMYLSLNASPRWIVPAAFGDRSRLDGGVHRHYLGPFPTPETRHAPWVLGCELAGSDPYYARLWGARQALADLPVSIVWGMKDPAFGAEYLARWRLVLPQASVTELPAAGHFPQEEDPDAVAAAIRSR